MKEVITTQDIYTYIHAYSYIYTHIYLYTYVCAHASTGFGPGLERVLVFMCYLYKLSGDALFFY